MYVGREILEMDLYDAVAHFNIGTSVVLKIFKDGASQYRVQFKTVRERQILARAIGNQK